MPFLTSYVIADIDECSSGTHECDENADCVNSVASHQCSCKTGFVGDGKNCQGTPKVFFEQKTWNTYVLYNHFRCFSGFR